MNFVKTLLGVGFVAAATSALAANVTGAGATFRFRCIPNGLTPINYLSKVSADWKSKVGEGAADESPIGVGAKGNEGVSGNVGQTRNSIGYVEYAYAKQNRMTYTAMVNKAGAIVQPNMESFQAAASNADWAKAQATTSTSLISLARSCGPSPHRPSS